MSALLFWKKWFGSFFVFFSRGLGDFEMFMLKRISFTFASISF